MVQRPWSAPYSRSELGLLGIDHELPEGNSKMVLLGASSFFVAFLLHSLTGLPEI